MHFFTVFCISLLLSVFISLCSAQPNTTSDQGGLVLHADSLVDSLAMTSLSLALSDVYSCNSNYSTGLALDISHSRGLVVADAAASTDGNWLREVGTCKAHTMQSSIQRNSSLTGFSGESLESTNVPIGWKVPVSGKKLRLGVPAEAGFGFTQFLKTNATTISGYHIDIFDSVMAELSDAVRYEYVSFETPDGSSARSYDDLLYQVLIGNYDVAVGDTTITAKRSEYIDLSLNNQWLLLKPLKCVVWLTVIALFILTGVALWILLQHKHKSHNQDFRGPPSEHVSLIFYTTFSSLLYAYREKTGTNLARVVVVVWVFVVLILSATYAANNLAARLTASKLQKADTDVNTLIRTRIRTEAGFNFKLLLEVERDPQNIPRIENIKYNNPDHKRFFLKALSSKLCLTIIALLALISAALCKNVNFYQRISNACSTVWSKVRVIFRHKDDSQNDLPNPNGASVVVDLPAEEMAGQNGAITPNTDHTAHQSDPPVGVV